MLQQHIWTTVDRSQIVEADFTILSVDLPETDDKILNITPEPFLDDHIRCEHTWDIPDEAREWLEMVFGA